MNYVIVSINWCDNHGIKVPSEARRSLDGAQVIFHEDFIDPVLRDKESIKSYRHDSQELKNILSSGIWMETGL